MGKYHLFRQSQNVILFCLQKSLNVTTTAEKCICAVRLERKMDTVLADRADFRYIRPPRQTCTLSCVYLLPRTTASIFQYRRAELFLLLSLACWNSKFSSDKCSKLLYVLAGNSTRHFSPSWFGAYPAATDNLLSNPDSRLGGAHRSRLEESVDLRDSYKLGSRHLQ